MHRFTSQFSPPKALLALLFIFPLTLQAQTLSEVYFSLTVPSEITVCDDPETMIVEYFNGESANLTNQRLTIDLPDGVSYLPGTLVNSSGHGVQEADISNLEEPIFSTNTLVNGNTLTFSFQYEADAEGRTFMLGGNTPRNLLTLTSDQGSVSAQSNAYNILYPSLSITAISPSSQTAYSGDIATREITVLNGGYGRVSNFYLTDVYGAGIDLTAINIGTLSGDTLYFSGSDFNSIGNGDNYFDSFESLLVTETFSISGCTETTVSSTIQTWWGCDTSITNASSPAHISIGLHNPSIAVSTEDSLSLCWGNGTGSQQSVTITNSGTGAAVNMVLDLFKSTGGSYNQSLFSKIDTSSITYQVGENGSPISISPAQVWNTTSTGSYSCLGSNPIGMVQLSLPDLPAGDSYVVKFDMFHCCIDACLGEEISGWKYALDYNNTCLNDPQARTSTGQGTKSALMTVFSETPADIYDGQEEVFTYTISSHTNDYAEEDKGYYEVIFSLPLGLVWKGDTSDLEWITGPNSWDPYYFDYQSSTKVLTARFALDAPFEFEKSEINLSLTGDCNEPGATAGEVSLNVDVNYQPDATCSPAGCTIPMMCDLAVTVDLHCPGPCNEGLNFKGFDLSRTNFGSPDNNQDGLADESGSLDFSRVRTGRAMVGDTIRGTYTGVVRTSGSYPNWTYGYAQANIELGSYLSSIGASVKIYDASAGTYFTCSAVSVSNQLSGNNQLFSYDFSVSTLSGSCSGLNGFQFADGDSIILYTDYAVTGNPGGLVQEVDVENSFYLSDIANPSSSSNKFQCGDYDGNYTLIGYYFRSNSQNDVTVNNCSNVLSQNFYLSIGDCCSNYAGGNLFPYEYRHWAYMKQAKVVIPDNYEILDITFEQKRTQYTNRSVTESVTISNADQTVGDTLFFDLSQYYTHNGGSINLSDDGFNGSLEIRVAPTCDVPTNTWADVPWGFTFQPAPIIGGTETGWYTETADRVRFLPPSIKLSSPNPVQDGIKRLVTWTLRVKNNSSSGGMRNAWIHLTDPDQEIIVQSVVEKSSGDTIQLTGDIYQLGDIATGTTKRYQITGTYVPCDPADLTVHGGYECSAYPANFADFVCPYSTYTLGVEPEPSELQMRISGNTIGDVCDGQVQVTAELLSAQMAHVDSIYLVVSLPSSGSITPAAGGTALKYPLSGSFNSLADPTLSNNSYRVNTWEHDATLETVGLNGILDVSKNRLQIQHTFDLGSNFQTGEYIQLTAYSKRPCGEDLPIVRLIYDPSVKFQRGAGTGLETDLRNSWGASWADIDGDGDEDLLVTEYNHFQASILYRNNNDGTFTKLSRSPLTSDLGSNVGSTWGDYDNDGDLDLFMANNIRAANALYRNDGSGNFDQPEVGALTDYNGYCHSASWVDYDNDGHLDIFAADFMPTRFNQLYHNNGNGTFSLAEGSPIILEADFSMGGAWGDYDNDGLPDLFIANSWDNNNSLYHNEGNGQFTKVTSGPIVSDGGNSLGASWGDFDNDQDLDLYVTNASNQANFLYVNQGDGTFVRNTTVLPATDKGHSFGSAWFDVDNDGDLDLYVTNDNGTPNRLYMNNGDGTFTAPDGIDPVTDEENSTGAAVADIDQDGDLDLFVPNNQGQANTLYLNQKGNCNNWHCFTLEGTRSNRTAIGAKIHLKANIYGQAIWQTREIAGQTGGISTQSSLKAHFGLGDATTIDSVWIQWPSGYEQYMTGLSANGCLTVAEDTVSKISGTVFNDENGNCTYDEGEAGIPNVQLVIEPSGLYVATDENGIYEFYADTGSYTIRQLAEDNFSQPCYQTINVDLSETGGNQSIVNPSTDNNFPNQANCSDKDLSVTLASTSLRRGFYNTYAISYYNRGPVAATNLELAVTVSDIVMFLQSTQDWDTTEVGSGTLTYVWSLDSLPAYSAYTILLTDSVSADATIGDPVVSTAVFRNAGTDCDSTDNTFVENSMVSGAIDPNDLQVFPQGNIEPQDSLTYLIRFQNVGTSPAQHITLTDMLSPYIDPNSVKVLESSHSYTMQFDESGNLVFRFNYIFLPDSTQDEVNSHGYLRFSAKPIAGVEHGTQIQNQVAILFDFSDPLLTNEVINTVLHPGATTERYLQIAPNPMIQDARFQLMMIDLHQPIGEIKSWEVYTLTGRRILQESGPVNSFMLSSHRLSTGSYYVKVVDELNHKHSAKLIVK